MRHLFRDRIKQFAGGYIQGFGEPEYHFIAGLSGSVFECAYKASQHINPLTKLFLREFLGKPVGA